MTFLKIYLHHVLCTFLMSLPAVHGYEVGEEIINEDGISVFVTEKVENCELRSKENDYVIIEYTAEYTDNGEQLDDSANRYEQEFFRIGQHRVMHGWEVGLLEMCARERRDLYLSGPGLEGDLTSKAKIPEKDRDVLYHFELIKIMEKPPTPNIFKKIDSNKDNSLSKSEMSKFIKAGQVGSLNHDNINTMFDNQDIDGDGVISHEEFKGPKHDEF